MTAIVWLSCAPLGLLLAWHTTQALRDREERLLRSLQDSSHALATQIEAELDASADLLDVLAASGLAQRPEAPEDRLRDARLRRPVWHSLFVDDATATAANRPSAGAQGREVAAVPIGPDNEPAVRISVNAGEGRRLGAWIKLRQWLDLVAATTPAAAHSAGGFVAVLDERRRVIAGSPGAAAVSLQPQRADVASAVGSSSGRSGRGQAADGTATYAAWQPLRLSGWSVIVGVPAAPFDRDAAAAVLTSLLGSAGCLLLGLALAWRVAQRVTQPLAGMARVDGLPPMSPVEEVAELQIELAHTRASDRAALRKLQEQADELEAAFETSPVPMALCQDAGCASWRHNRAMRGLLGTWQSPLPEMLRDGRPIEPAERALHAAASRGLSTPSHEQEWRFPAPIGTRWVLVQAEPLLDGHGRPRGAVEAVVDITPLKRAMQRLAQARDRLQQAQHLIDAAQLVGRVGFLRYDFHTDELRPTRGLTALFNTGTEAPLFDDSGHGILWAGVALQAPQTLASWLRQLNAGDRLAMQRAIAEMAAQHKSTYELNFALPENDHPRHASARLLMRFDSTGRPAELMGVIVDTSEHQRAVDSRTRVVAVEQHARMAAEAASAAKDDLLAMLGHELRNPLNALSAAVEVLKSLQPPGDALASEAREVVERQARQLTRLTNEFLDMARVTSGAAELDRAPTDLHAMTTGLVEELQPTAAAAHRTLEASGSASWISADRDRIRQMLRKLFDHALSRAGPGGAVHAHVAPDGRGVLLRLGWTVRATVPATESSSTAVAALMADAAQRDSAAHGGMTLGLEWANTLAGLHGSRVEWRARAGGAEAALRFDGLPSHDRTGAAGPGVAMHGAAPRTLLLVEDNEDAAQSLGAALKMEGHRVTHAADGLQGLSLLLAERPEVAVVDIGLPGMGGLALARQARGAGYSGLLIALSGYCSDEDIAQALRSGFDAFVAKPADMGRLNQLITSRS